MPLDVQLRELQKERRAQTAEGTRFEKATFPTRTELPVSELSVQIWGDKAWHSQSKKAMGALPTHKPLHPPEPRWSRKMWDVDHMQYVRETLGSAHVKARERAQAQS